jgi:phosphoenolpyruvate-protein phosphotransferase
MLTDSSLREEIRHQIERQLIGAAQALAEVFRRWQMKFRAKPQQSVQDRADDLADLEGRLLREIAGVRTTSLEQMPLGRVLVAHRLLPSETVALPQRDVAGIVLEFGGLGSHAALLARALGVPTVAQIPNALQRIANEDEVIVDGFDGAIVIRPDAAALQLYEKRIRGVESRARCAKKKAASPARTVDGTGVTVMANVGGRGDVVAALDQGADGIGLYRMEQFYLARTTPPTQDELLAEWRATFEPAQRLPITVRLLDLGADKPVSFLNFPIEDDPFLGCRGVRLLLRYPDLLDVQLAALLDFAKDYQLRILVPMVTLASEMAEIRHRLAKRAAEVGLAVLPPLGAMIETPAAALTVPDFLPHADFFSIGTNDLTQYTMAAGRENPLVNHYFQEHHSAVLRLIKIVVTEAGGMPVSVCGELAGQLDSTDALVEIGVRHLSVAPPLVPPLKERIRQVGTKARHEV